MLTINMLKGKEYLSFVLVLLVVIEGSDACLGSSGGGSQPRATTPKPRPTCPNIYPRASWGARSSAIPLPSIPTPPYVFIHHSGTPSCYSVSACQDTIRGFQRTHLDEKKWWDIAYSFLVDEAGNIYEGRGWGKEGGHTPGYTKGIKNNRLGIGICIIGNFSNRAPNKAALDAVKSLIACGVDRGHIQSDYTLRGHRDMSSTVCPGDRLYKIIQGWPHY